MDDMERTIIADHLGRKAYVYLRGTAFCGSAAGEGHGFGRHGLRDLALGLGWREDQVVMIEDDLGLSGLSSSRAGFRRLVEEVLRHRAGIVVVQEASRLTRDLTEWRRFVEACAASGTLILVDGVLYDPSLPDDRIFMVGEPNIDYSSEVKGLKLRRRGHRRVSEPWIVCSME